MINNEKFPYDSMPVRLDVKSKKLTTELCFFADLSHAQKYIDRYRLKPKDYEVSNRYGKSIKPNQKHTRSVESSTRKKSDRSSSPSKGRTTRMDSSRNTTRNSKSKK